MSGVNTDPVALTKKTSFLRTRSISALSAATSSPRRAILRKNTSQKCNSEILRTPESPNASVPAYQIIAPIPIQGSLADGKSKSKKTFKQAVVSLSSTKLVLHLTKKDKDYEFALESFCMIQIGEDPGAASVSSPSRKKKEQELSFEVLLCTKDLHRVWLRFANQLEYLNYVLALDGMFFILFQSYLLDHTERTALLNELQELLNRPGGTLKVGDDEEWNYDGKTGHLMCTMTADTNLLYSKFIFNGQHLQLINSNYSLGNGTWDGINLFWYADIIPNERQRRKFKPIAAYQYVPVDEEYLFIDGTTVSDDPALAWKWTRNFLAHKNGEGSDWIQAEGDLPPPITMFLRMIKDYLYSLQHPNTSDRTSSDS